MSRSLGLFSLTVAIVIVTVAARRGYRNNHGKKNVFHLTIYKDPGSNSSILTDSDPTSPKAITNWTQNSNNRKANEELRFATFHRCDGTIEIKKRGPYMIYASVGYSKSNTSYSQFLVDVDGTTILKCRKYGTFETTETDPQSRQIRYSRINVCRISGTVYLYKDQKVSIKTGRKGWVIVDNIDVSYWGIVKL